MKWGSILLALVVYELGLVSAKTYLTQTKDGKSFLLQTKDRKEPVTQIGKDYLNPDEDDLLRDSTKQFQTNTNRGLGHMDSEESTHLHPYHLYQKLLGKNKKYTSMLRPITTYEKDLADEKPTPLHTYHQSKDPPILPHISHDPYSPNSSETFPIHETTPPLSGTPPIRPTTETPMLKPQKRLHELSSAALLQSRTRKQKQINRNQILNQKDKRFRSIQSA